MDGTEKTRDVSQNITSDAADAGYRLELIKELIDKSRRDVERYTGRVMLLWGALVFVTALVVGHLWRHTGNASWNLLWIFMAVVGIATASVMTRVRGVTPRSFVSKVTGFVWAAFGGSCFVVWILGVVAANLGLCPLPVTPVIILLMGFAGVVTGYIIDNRLIMGGATGGAVVCASYALIYAGPYEMIAMALHPRLLHLSAPPPQGVSVMPPESAAACFSCYFKEYKKQFQWTTIRLRSRRVCASSAR